jgi:hypothetical protein
LRKRALAGQRQRRGVAVFPLDRLAAWRVPRLAGCAAQGRGPAHAGPVPDTGGQPAGPTQRRWCCGHQTHHSRFSGPAPFPPVQFKIMRPGWDRAPGIRGTARRRPARDHAADLPERLPAASVITTRNGGSGPTCRESARCPCGTRHLTSAARNVMPVAAPAREPPLDKGPAASAPRATAPSRCGSGRPPCAACPETEIEQLKTATTSTTAWAHRPLAAGASNALSSQDGAEPAAR